VREAYSKPPGTNPIVFFNFISLAIFSGFTAYTPQSLSWSPQKGTANKNRLASAVRVDILLSSAFILPELPKLVFNYKMKKHCGDESRK
jgi:hypothetical protein